MSCESDSNEKPPLLAGGKNSPDSKKIYIFKKNLVLIKLVLINKKKRTCYPVGFAVHRVKI